MIFKKAKSSALYFTLMAMVLVSALVSAFVLWSVYFNVKNHQDFAKIKLAQLLNDSEGIVNYYQAELSEIPFVTSVYNSGDSIFLTKKPYGVFDIISFKVSLGQFTHYKDYISAFVGDYDSTALHLANSNSSLKMVGEVNLQGNVYLSDKGFERAYIEGKSYTGTKFLEGNQKISDEFPLVHQKLNDRLDFLLQSININLFDTVVSIASVASDTCFISKGKLGLLLMDDSDFFQKKLIGKWVVYSKGNIYISSYFNTSGQVFIANEIEVESGFKGELQLFAIQKVEINENVNLQYPSYIFIKTYSENSQEINIQSGSKILGGIFLIGQNNSANNPSIVKLHNNSLIIGQVYSSSLLQLSGKVFGNVYANKLYLKTNSSVYENLLMDCSILVSKKDKQLINIPFNQNGKHQIIDWE